jgi:hypothetical protein
VEDPAFENFYKHTLNNYVQRWDLGLDRVMKRERFMNLRQEFDPKNKFQYYRGDPSYAEAREPFVAGVDLLATQYAAWRAFAYFQAFSGHEEEAQAALKNASDVKALINSTWWNDKEQCFYSFLDADHHLTGCTALPLLYWNAAEDGPKAKAALDRLLASIKQNPSSGVEGESHYPEILYRYGAPDAAYAEIMDLTRPGRERQEYPEVSYSVIGAIVSGLMGVSVEPSSPLESSLQGNYVEVVLKTLPALSNQTAWAGIHNLPVRRNMIAVEHNGLRKTTLTNQSGPSLVWQATFLGAYGEFLVNGKPTKAHSGKELLGRVTSWIRIPVGAGDTVQVQVKSN